MKRFLPALALIAMLAALVSTPAGAPRPLQSAEQFLGFKVGADARLARWDRIVEYMKQAAAGSSRVRYRELGKTTNGNPFVAVEISAPDTLKDLGRYKELERKLYFQAGAPTESERRAILAQGKVVVLVTCSLHATEIGASQMSLELVHRLATEQSPDIKKILDNVILVLVPSLNPDGQILVTDWFNQQLGTPYEGSPIPYLYHPYVGHDNNRDMYMFTQKESRLTAELAWHDWFPSVWLDEHQMAMTGARIFVMPATDPINPNVHPLIYRWNAILGQSQAAALESAGKDGIIHNTTFTNFWEGAMAWSGWWHNEIGLLTEVASVRIANPVDQLRAVRGQMPSTPAPGDARATARELIGGVLPPPVDITPRSDYPRPWMGGHWSLRDIVDYELIATMALLQTVADRRETLLGQILEVNRQTIEDGAKGHPSAILVPIDNQHDPREAAHLVDRLRIAGVDVYRAEGAFAADGLRYPAGTYVIPMAQVFARYAKDMLERQTYPDVRRAPTAPSEPPYDVTAWSLGMLLGVNTVFVDDPLPGSLKLTAVTRDTGVQGIVKGSGSVFTFPYNGADTAIAINRLLKSHAAVSFSAPSQFSVTGVSTATMQSLASDFGLTVTATEPSAGGAAAMLFHAPRIGLYEPWTGGNMDEGWTRWVLDQYEFPSIPIHNADIRGGNLRDKLDVIVLADQSPREIIDGYDGDNIRPEYRGGVGDVGVANLRQFVAAGGTLVAMGAASDLPIDFMSVPVRDVKRALTRDQHFAPGAIVHIEVDTSNPLAYGLPFATSGFYSNSPFFSVASGFASEQASVVARYPNANVLASGWLDGERLMAGRAAVVAVDMNPGRIVLFGLRPQHRAQTHATFPMLFNALYLSATDVPVRLKPPS